MKYSLITVEKRVGDLVSGAWLRNHIGSLDSAIKMGETINAANSGRLDIAVVDEVSGPCVSRVFERKTLGFIAKSAEPFEIDIAWNRARSQLQH